MKTVQSATLVLLLILFSAHLTMSAKYPIKHVVVLMMENRSYDHMLGWMKNGGKYGNPDVNGVDGTEFNYINSEKPGLGKVYVKPDALDCSAYDPGHMFTTTTTRIFDCDFEYINIKSPKIKSPCINHASVNGTASMGGFVRAAY